VSVVRHRLSVTHGQTVYLHELINDDLRDTDLTPQEEAQARSLLLQLDTLMQQTWGRPVRGPGEVLPPVAPTGDYPLERDDGLPDG
jgi:hypothetical protein